MQLAVFRLGMLLGGRVLYEFTPGKKNETNKYPSLKQMEKKSIHHSVQISTKRTARAILFTCPAISFSVGGHIFRQVDGRYLLD